MKRLMLMLCLFLSGAAYSQNAFKAVIKDRDSKEPLVGATVLIKGTTVGATADVNGELILKNVPVGKQTLVFSYVGYEPEEKSFVFPLKNDVPIEILLEGDSEELEEVVVSTTRSSRTIEDIPTRVEAITAEELGEKAVMNSSNISMILRESTGIQIQQTSANSANQSIRIQGLDGRYTQLLRDGFPLFGGFASGLSIMQIPPLDLRQVEVVKGSASTLYGGGAIAGLVNLVTKKPEEEPELSFMLNQTSANGTTLNGFYAQKYDKLGVSLYASGNRQEPYDPNEDNFSDIPKVRSLTVSPRLFYYFNDETTLWFGVNGSLEERIGGDISVIDGERDVTHQFSEENISKRVSTQLKFDKAFDSGAEFTFKNSISYFNREIIVPDYRFEGEQVASFSEATYSFGNDDSFWILGANLLTDDFREEKLSNPYVRDYKNVTVGGFAQNTLAFAEKFTLESGLRTDYNTEYGTFVLPRASLLFKPSKKFSGRIGGGLGYKLPTIFTEEAEALTFEQILPINRNDVDAETSAGLNFDVNYKTLIGDKVTLSLNQLFFYTRLNNAMVLRRNPNTNFLFFENADGPVDSKGFETNAKFTYGDFKLFLQYAFTDAKLHYDGMERQKPLTPKHTAGAVLMFEQHGKWRIGYEAYYTGPQYLSDLTKTRDYWIMGLMALREFEKVSVFLNFENFIDSRQSRYQQMVYPPVNNPSFAEIWAPTDGFVVNGGFIIKLFGKEHH